MESGAKIERNGFYFDSLEMIENFLQLISKKEEEIRDLYERLEKYERQKDPKHGVPSPAGFDAAAAGDKITTLIADPVVSMRTHLKEIIRHSNVCTIIGEATDTGSLWNLYSRFKPNLIVTELNLPSVEEGYAVLRKIRETDRHVLILIISSQDDDNTILRAMELGAFDYIQKPISHLRLSRAIGKLRQPAA